MGKGGRTKNKSKRSLLPRGIPQKRTQTTTHSNTTISPFEYARSTNSSSRVKHHVHNKQVSGAANSTSKQHQKHTSSALAKSIERRKSILKSQLSAKSKSNTFIDRRIGEATAGMQQSVQEEYYDGLKKRREDAMLKRIVAERVRRSKRGDKFRLDDDDDDEGFGLTHRVSFVKDCLLACSFDLMLA